MHPDRLVTLSADDISVVIDLQLGARAVSWTVDGEELLGAVSTDPVEFGMYPMAPWSGRLRDNAVVVDGQLHPLPVTYGPWALHGTALAQVAHLVEVDQSPDEGRLSARLDAHPGWPWPMSVVVDWWVKPAAITTSIRVHSHEGSFPVVLGWHPWFRRRLSRGRPLEWSLDATGRLVRGADHLPTGEIAPYTTADGPFDDAFRATNARIRWPDALSIDVSSGGWFVIYDERPDLVCVEPQNGPPDGLSTGHGTEPTWATVDRPVEFTTVWSIRRIGDQA